MPAATSPLTQTQRRVRTRSRLLDAAYEVFSREGYHGATLDAIAARADVSKGALYYNFASKEDLFLVLLEEQLAARVTEVAGDRAVVRPPRVTPERWAARAMETLALDREWNLLFWEFACFAARRPEHGRRFVARLRSSRAGAGAWLGGVLAGAGIGAPFAPERLVSIMAALANGLALDVMLEPGDDREAEAREAMATAMALLWRGMVSASQDSASGARPVRRS